MSKRGVCWTVAAVTALCVAVGSADVVRRDLRKNVGGDEIPVMVVRAGPHYLTTPVGSSAVPVTVPAGFFFEGSEAVEVLADMAGVPIAPKPRRADRFKWVFGRPGAKIRLAEAYDTVMVQYQDAVLPVIGSQATVDLKLDVVRMKSPDTIAVTGSDETREYQVALELRPYHQEQGRTEEMGWMHFTRTGLGTGKFTAEFFAWARYTFTPVDGGRAVFYDLEDRLTITVHDKSATRFYLPALQDLATTVEPEDAGRADPPPEEPCENSCCCCKTELAVPGFHCPAI